MSQHNTDEVLVADVIVGKRFRQDLGDINALAGSIDEIGLLQPIGITSSLELIFGQRRLEAAKQLGWEHIPARIIDIGAIVQGEFHENEFREDFTPSERVAITDALRTYCHGGDRKSSANEGENQNDKCRFDPVPVGEAAKKAGFSGAREYQRAKKVTANGTPELVKAMDSGDISISDAAAVAAEPETIQNKAVKTVKAGKAKTAQQASGKKSGPEDGFDRINDWLGKAIRESDALRAGRLNRYADDFRKQIDIALKIISAWRKNP